ncbi:MAG: non-ribosomal peptide synthetase, partial [Waterburya sp.]
MIANINKFQAKISTTKYYPLTFSQQRIWFISQLNPDSSAYNCPTAIRLQGELNYSALNQAFSIVIARHSSFCSNFITKDGQPYRVINDDVDFKLSLVDLAGLNEQKSQIEVHNIAEKEAVTLFDLVTDLLIRGQLLKLGDRDNILLLTIHHIIWDYWSWWLLWQEISQVYNEIAQQKEYSLKPLAISYEDYGTWQQEQILTPEWQKQEKYWCSRFADELPILDLPKDLKRPSLQTYQGNTQRFILDATVSQKLKKLALTTRTSLFIVLLAAYNAFLARYTNQEDLIVGIPVAGRNYLNVKSLIGCFVNTLPIRANLAENPTFIELVKQIGQEVLAANQNQLYPFEELVKTLNLKRDMSRSPLFQTVFMFRDELLDGLNLLDIEHSAITIKEKTAKFDLTVCVYPSAESLKIEFEYSTDLFKAETIKGMMDNFATLLTSIAAAPDIPIAQLNLLSPQEKQQLLREWNTTLKPYPQNSCIHHLIEAQVAKTPDAIAVAFEEQTLTYTQLNQQANQLAGYLQKQGVSTETLVGISIERSPLMLVSLLAVLKAGGAYVPLDPSYPQDRLALMVEDSQLSILITKQPATNILPNYLGTSINLNTDWSRITLESTDNLNNEVTAQNLAYIIYTSGSTGKPKGVQIAHQGVVNFLTSMAREPGITSDDILLAVTSISFDIAVLELFLPLTVGAKVIIASQSETINGIKLLKLIPKAQVTMMQATPATWKMLQARKWDKIQSIKMLCGGEAMSEELAAWMLQYCSSLWNVYGPTETTVWATVHQVQPDDKPIPIGNPLANTQIQIFDRYGQLVPIGVPG